MTNLVTNLPAIATQAAAIVSNPINWTTIGSIITICCAVVFGLIKISENRRIVNDTQLQELIKEIREKCSKLEEKHENLKDAANELTIDIEKLKIEVSSGTASLKDLKQDYKEIVQRLDDLLKQIVDSLGD